MISVRRARTADAPGIGAVHVASWRSAYPGTLPDEFLANLSVVRQASYYDRTIRAGAGVHVAHVSGADLPNAGTPRVVGFSTASPVRPDRATLASSLASLGEGEIETLYVLDDWKERGIGRRLLRASAQHLAALGCRSVFLWVLRDNPANFFYTHLGGRRQASGTVSVAGLEVPQVAYVWDPIEVLLAEAT